MNHAQNQSSPLPKFHLDRFTTVSAVHEPEMDDVHNTTPATSQSEIAANTFGLLELQEPDSTEESEQEKEVPKNVVSI